ncbi:MAG: translocation/assembly module TamB domain-containing protein [Erythrobacter sp.]
MAGELDPVNGPDADARDDADAPERPENASRRRWFKRLGWVLFGLLAPLVLAAAFLSSPIGKRFVADQIAALELDNGLRFRVGRIEGDIYGRARLRDVAVSDLQGVFLTLPEVVLDWRPLAFLWSGLDIREVTTQRGVLKRLPELRPGDPDSPLLPGFDIRIDRLTIADLTLAEGVATAQAEKVNLTANVLIRKGRAAINATSSLGSADRLALMLDAEPDGDRFDLGLDYVAPAGGVLAGLAGLKEGYVARIAGEGTWSNWRGHAVAKYWPRPDDAAPPLPPVAGFRITNRAGRFGILGQLRARPDDGSLLDSAMGDAVSLATSFLIDERLVEGRAAVVSEAIDLRLAGGVDLGRSKVERLTARLALRDADLLGPDLRLEQARFVAAITGPFSDLAIDHQLAIERLAAGEIEVRQLKHSSMARYTSGTLSLPLAITAGRVTTGNDLVDPRLVNGRLDGKLVYDGARVFADETRIAFRGLGANLSLRGDVAEGAYAIAGPVTASGFRIENAGDLNANAKILAKFGPNVPWSLRANLAGVLSRIGNATIVNLAGPQIRFNAALGMGQGQPIIIRDGRIISERLTASLDSRVAAGSDGPRTVITGSGQQAQYGPFTLDAELAADGPRAVLVLADPLPAAGLTDVRVALAPSEDGFAIDLAGGSLLGPFTGNIGLVLPEDAPTRIAVNEFEVFRTRITGGFEFAEGGVDGRLAIAGGGINGNLELAPASGGAQGFSLDLTARQARFGGDTPIAIGRADITATGRFDGDSSSISGRMTGTGFQFGALTLANFDGRASIANGAGKATLAIAGQRADRFALKLDADIAPGRIAALARGEYAGSAIRMPRRAVLTQQEEGGWVLAPSQIGYGGGFAILEGQFGGEETAFTARLARMPMRLIDLAGAELGFGGRLSGIVTYSQRSGAAPVGNAKVRIDRFTRAGLVLSSQPVNVVAVADLSPAGLAAGARLLENGTRLGQVKARITKLTSERDFTSRLMRGALDAQLAYDGPAESLWRLAGIETFDITGPLEVTATARGTLANPVLRGTMTSDDLRVQSAVSGTDITNATARGEFAGSRLRITRFAGQTSGNGTVTGSGIIDLAGLSAARGPRIDLRAAANNARLLNANGLDARLTGPLRIVSDGVGGTIAGRVRIDRAGWRLATAAEDMALPQIPTREINRASGPATAQRASRTDAWRYLVNATAPSRVRVEGMGLDSEWGIDIALRGTVDDPRIGGTATLVRGEYTFAGTDFELTRGRIVFDQSGPIDPELDILAETARSGANIGIGITGSAMMPQISFSSTPPLPDEEILARLLFGGSVTSLSATDALQLAAALASLQGGGGGLDPIGSLRSSIGLDQLRIIAADPIIGRETSVALGKNLSRRFYVELITDGRDYNATQLEYRITNWLVLLGLVSTIGRDSLLAQVRKDY